MSLTLAFQTIRDDKLLRSYFSTSYRNIIRLLFYQNFSQLQHRDTQETLTVLDRLDLDTEKPSAEEVAKKFGFEDDYYSGNLSWWQKTKPKIWSMFDEPYSSSAAKVSSFYKVCFGVVLLLCSDRVRPTLSSGKFT